MSAGVTPANEWSRFAPPPRPLTGDDKWNVFLSYRSVNRAWVLNLYDVLCQQGHAVFIDQCALKAGDELIDRLEEALETSQSGVFIYSPATPGFASGQKGYPTLQRLATDKAG